MEPDDYKRWLRNARALGRKADDAEGLAQVLELLEEFNDQAMAAVDQLRREHPEYSWKYLTSALQVSPQALQQRHARWWARQAASLADSSSGVTPRLGQAEDRSASGADTATLVGPTYTVEHCPECEALGAELCQACSNALLVAFGAALVDEDGQAVAGR